LIGEMPEACERPHDIDVPTSIIIQGKTGMRICEGPYSIDDCMEWCERVLDSMREG
jgi:hypothetical protein